MSDTGSSSEDRIQEIIAKFADADRSLSELLNRATNLEEAANSYNRQEENLRLHTQESINTLKQAEIQFTQHADSAATVAETSKEVISNLQNVLENFREVMQQLASLNPDRLHEDLRTLQTQITNMDTRVNRLQEATEKSILSLEKLHEESLDKTTLRIQKLQDELIKRITITQVIAFLAVLAAIIAAVR